MKFKKGFNAKVISAILGLFAIVIIMAIWGISQTYTADIIEDVKADQITNTAGCNSTTTTGCGYAYNVSGNALDAQTTLSEKQDNISTVVIAGAIILILVAAFSFVLKDKLF